MAERSANASSLPTLAAPNYDNRKTDSVVPSNEITSTASRAGDKSLSSSWIQRFNPRDSLRDEEIHRLNPVETCSDIEYSENLEEKEKPLQESESITTVRSSTWKKLQETESQWKLSSRISLNTDNGTKSMKEKDFNASAVFGVVAKNRESLFKKEKMSFLQSRCEFGPQVCLSPGKRNVLRKQSDFEGISNDSDSKSKKLFDALQQDSNPMAQWNSEPAVFASSSHTPFPSVSKNLLFYLRHIHEKKRGISLNQSSLNDFSMNSSQEAMHKDPLPPQPHAIIKTDLALDAHIKGSVTDRSGQEPQMKGRYSKQLYETIGSIHLAEEIILKERSKECSVSDCQLSQIPSSDPCLKISNDNLEAKSWGSRKLTANMEPKVTMVCLESSPLKTSDDKNRNLSPAFDLCIKSSQYDEERVQKRARFDSENQRETHTDGFVLDLNIGISAENNWNQPSPHVPSEQRDVIVEGKAKPSQFLDVMVKNMASKQEKGTIWLFDGISKQTAGFLKDRVPDNSRIEQSSSMGVSAHGPKLSFDLNEEYKESPSVDEVVISQDPYEVKESICGKSQRDMSVDLTSQDIAEKLPAVPSPSMYQIWIQRWCSATFHHGEGMSSHARVLIGGAKRNCYRYLALGVNHLKDGEFCRIFAAGGTGMIDNASTVNDQALEELNMSYAKATPSAAAMAIVGTAARQFCNISSQQKRSFSFWSSRNKRKTRSISKSDP